MKAPFKHLERSYGKRHLRILMRILVNPPKSIEILEVLFAKDIKVTRMACTAVLMLNLYVI